MIVRIVGNTYSSWMWISICTSGNGGRRHQVEGDPPRVVRDFGLDFLLLPSDNIQAVLSDCCTVAANQSPEHAAVTTSAMLVRTDSNRNRNSTAVSERAMDRQSIGGRSVWTVAFCCITNHPPICSGAIA